MTDALYRAGLPAMALADAVQKLGDDEATALLYSPRCFRFAKLAGGRLCNEKGDSVDTDDVFEARLFNERFELRWLQSGFVDGRRQGEAVVVHGGNVSFAGSEPRPTVGTCEQRYVLWGRANGEPANRWSALVSARIGTLWVPIEVAGGEGVQLVTREYFEDSGHDGNVIVGEERLIRLCRFVPEKE